MKLVPVNPDDFPDIREGRRGRVSYPLLKSFLETNERLVMVDRTGMQQSMQGLTSCLGSYIRSHGLPIKLITRSGQIYLARTDIDSETNEIASQGTIEDYSKAVRAPGGSSNVVEIEHPGATPINASEVKTRFAVEKDQVGK